MIISNVLRFDLNFFKFLGYHWDVERFPWYQIAYCVALLLVKESFDFYFFFQHLLTTKTPSVDKLFLFVLRNFSYILTAILNIIAVLVSIAFHRKTRKNLSKSIDKWKTLMIAHDELIDLKFEGARKLVTYTTMFLLASSLSLSFYVKLSTPFKWEFKFMFQMLSGAFDRVILFLQPKLYSEFIHIVILQFKITNKVALKREIPIKQLRRVYVNLSDNIRMLNSCFEILILFEVMKNFFILIGYVFYFSRTLSIGTANVSSDLLVLFMEFLLSILTFPLIFIASESVNEEVWRFFWCLS